MRPIKPKKMPEALERCIKDELADPSDDSGQVRLGRREARAVLAALEYERQRAEQLRRVGSVMSNVCFNLSQQRGKVLDQHDCEVMDELRREWDAATTKEPK